MRYLGENAKIPQRARDDVIVTCSNGMSSLVAGLVILSISLKRSREGRLTTLLAVVVNISAADVLSSTGSTMSAFTHRYYDPDIDNLSAKKDGICRTQAIFIQFLLASFLWSACFAHLMYQYVKAKVDRKEALENQGIIWTYGGISWGGALLSILISGSLDAFEPTQTTWCWMGEDQKTYRVVIFYIPLLICMFCGILAMVLSHRYIRKKTQSPSTGQATPEDCFNYDSLEFLPQRTEEEPIFSEDPMGVALELAPFVLVFILVWTVPAINRFYTMIEGSENLVLTFIQDLVSPLHGMFNATILIILVKEIRPRTRRTQVEERKAVTDTAVEPDMDGTMESINNHPFERFEVEATSSLLLNVQEEEGTLRKLGRLIRKYLVPMALCYLCATHLFVMHGEVHLTRDFSPFLKIFVQAASGAIACGTCLAIWSCRSVRGEGFWSTLAPFCNIEFVGAMVVLSLLILYIPLLLVVFARDTVNTTVISSCTTLIPVLTVFLKFILIQSVEKAPNTRMLQSFESDDEGAVTIFSKEELVSKENIKFQKRIIAARLVGYLVAVGGAFVVAYREFREFDSSEVSSGVPYSIMLAICWSVASVFNKVCCAETSPLAKAFCVNVITAVMSVICGGALTIRDLITFDADVSLDGIIKVIATGIFVTGFGLVVLLFLYDTVSEENTQATWFFAVFLLTIVHWGQSYAETDSPGEMAAQIFGMLIIAGGVFLAYRLYSTEQAAATKYGRNGESRETTPPMDQLVAHDFQ